MYHIKIKIKNISVFVLCRPRHTCLYAHGSSNLKGKAKTNKWISTRHLGHPVDISFLADDSRVINSEDAPVGRYPNFASLHSF